jgi:hypothetical protein
MRGIKMATEKKKAPAKKSPSKSTVKNEFQVNLILARETKNTYRYETDDEDAAINPLYIQKSAFPGEGPQGITVTVTAVSI